MIVTWRVTTRPAASVATSVTAFAPSVRTVFGASDSVVSPAAVAEPSSVTE